MGIELAADRNMWTASIESAIGRVAGSNILIPQNSAPTRTFPQSHYRCGLKRVAITPPVHQPQPFSVGVFFWRIALVPAYLRGFLRTPADFAGQSIDWLWATFRSLQAIFLSYPDLSELQGVRKGRQTPHYRSTSYKRTNQVVGLRHWLGGGEQASPDMDHRPPIVENRHQRQIENHEALSTI